ncbi:Ferrichrome-iron receptor [Serratia fonticola AU-P3(3)]|nr:Ferrichrome-iron receptor [Serratia fonticola AU-P3(3)]
METKNTVLNTDSTDARTDDHFDSGFSPYMSYSSAVTPAVLAHKEGHLLKPTTSEQYEAGLKYQPPGSSSIYSIAL